MIVYANYLHLQPHGGPDTVIALLAQWIGGKVRTIVNVERLATGISELKFPDGSALSSVATLTLDRERRYPYYFSAAFKHRDPSASGRMWVTEIGIHQSDVQSEVLVTILLRTDEISTRVNRDVQVSRPRVVLQLMRGCNPVDPTPSLQHSELSLETVDAFRYEIGRADRKHPIVVISPTVNGRFIVDPRRVIETMAGLAHVYQIPPEENTFSLEAQIGRLYSTYRGGTLVIYPKRASHSDCFVERVYGTDAELMVQGGKQLDTHILELITHRMNIPNSWRHISNETVRRENTRVNIQRLLEQKDNNNHAIAEEYNNLLHLGDVELQQKSRDIDTLCETIDQFEEEIRELRSAKELLQHSLEAKRQTGRETLYDQSAIYSVRAIINDIASGKASVRRVLELVSILWSDRVVILQSAFNSADVSDGAGFDEVDQCFELLVDLVSSYWESLASGNSDQAARVVFGNSAYASNEGSALSETGRKRRTFDYNGRSLLMERHLRIGTKDSKAKTLRIHFEWLAEEKKILIGHCGPHLDF